MTIKEYRKTATIKAEQFIGNDFELSNLAAKYDIDDKYAPMIGDYYYSIKTLEGRMDIEKGDWIATGVNGEHWAIKPDVFEKTYEEITGNEN